MRLEVSVPVVQSRYVIVHYHIFKNAGTTIEYILEREFSGRFATLHGHGSEAVLDAGDVLEFLRRHPGIAAVSSHHLRYPKPLSRRMVFFDCCFLRNPLDRLLSSYGHFRRSNLDDAFSRWARSYSPREFVNRLINEAPHLVRDVQVTQLASAGAFTRPAGEQDLERAAAVIRDMAIPGLVEMFDQSLVAAEYFLRPAFPTLRLEYVSQNVGRAPHHVAVRSREFWEDLWGKDLYERLLRMNEMDLELILRAKREILRRLDEIPRVSEKLAGFQARCARLEGAAAARRPALKSPPGVAAAEETGALRAAAGG